MDNASIPKFVGMGAVVLVAATIVFGSFYTIDQGDRGVILCNGAICGEADAGLHWKMPMIQSVAELSFRSQKFSMTLGTPTVDKQLATIDMVVQWRPTNASRIYSDLKTVGAVEDQIIRPKVQEILGAEIGKVDSTTVINNRERISAGIEAELQRIINRSGVAVITSAVVTHIQLPQAYMDQVNETLKAQVAVQTAKADFERRKIAADTKAYEQTAAGEAEARAIRARGEALRDNPGLPTLIQAEATRAAVDKWNGQLPSSMIPGQAVPFINVK